LTGDMIREGWHFLTGREADIARAADAAGFGYAAVAQTNDFAHGAVILFASPQGFITRYLPGHVYPDRDFRLALTESAEGKQGSLFDMVLQLCYRYDATRGTYAVHALTLMKVAGAVTLVVLAGVIGGLFYFEHRRHATLAEGPGGPEKTGSQESRKGASQA
jgi:protein SCO1/2